MEFAIRQTKAPIVFNEKSLANIEDINDYRQEFEIFPPTKTRIPELEDDYFSLLNKTETGTVTVSNEYGSIQVSLTSTEEEIRRVIRMYNKAVAVFVAFGSISLISCAVFITLGFTESISILNSIFGGFLSGSLSLGVIIDFKKWEKRHV